MSKPLENGEHGATVDPAAVASWELGPCAGCAGKGSKGHGDCNECSGTGLSAHAVTDPPGA